ncbi:MAG: double-strand break repair helicase AddA [Hyphomicrobiaceae bacterium]
MNKPIASIDIQQELARTTKRQTKASDPKSSVWVSANAGTGKTHVLKMRVLRLLLSGTPPEKILCLTYTKAAAAEMSTRVFNELSKWVTKKDDTLREEIAKLIDDEPNTKQLQFARTLFTTAIETPGGLKVQTFHAFCEQLLQRFPLEANVSPGFTILDDEQKREILREAIDRALSQASASPDSSMGQSLHALVAFAVDERFDDLMATALANSDFQTIASLKPKAMPSDDVIEKTLRQKLAITTTGDESDITSKMANVLDDNTLQRMSSVMIAEGKKTDKTLGEVFKSAHQAGEAENRSYHFGKVFLTGAKTKRASLMTKAIREAHQDLAQAAKDAQEAFFDLATEREGLKTLAVMMALMRLAKVVHQSYAQIKASKAALDYDDLISKTASLLEGDGATEWVLFKLDNGIDHILVDESQDTSPQQWQVVETLAHEFFSGFGAHSDTKRTVFAVGDEKQSIYSFQGAVPHLFAEKGRQFNTMADNAGEKFSPIDLTLSFRTVSPILQAVDQVFADPLNAPGVARTGSKIHHAAKRAGQAGLVEMWPPEKPAETREADPWKPLDEETATSPVVRLADRIGDTIGRWLDTGEQLVSENRPIQAGDILILVRKRAPFAGPMVAALKARGIPVAGADRMVLTEQMAVQDLMALGDFLTLPEDDLSLACVLKSPMFGLNDDDLFLMTRKHKGTLWKALLDTAKTNHKHIEAADMLRAWRKRADFTPPFEFFSRLLDRDAMRAKFLNQLGAEAADPIDEMLNLALTYDEDNPPSLAGFVTWLRATNRKVKRDMDQGRNEVRVMTVHGAKGLEAPIVFLPDTCSTKSGGGGITLLPWANGDPDTTTPTNTTIPFIWPRKDFERIAAVADAKKQQQHSDIEERNRLLYVAMTRARDRLYIGGFLTGQSKEPQSGCWFETLHNCLAGSMETVGLTDGREVLRTSTPQTAPCDEADHDVQTPLSDQALPDWVEKKAPVEPTLAIPLAPSRLAPYETDDDGDPVRKEENVSPANADEVTLDPPVDTQSTLNADATEFTAITPEPQDPVTLPPTTMADGYRFLRGTLTHALLQHLPAFAQAERQQAAETFVSQRGAILSPRVRKSIVKETMAVLQAPQFANLFSPDSRAEVNIAAEIPNPASNGDETAPPLRLSGQIDRLVVEPKYVRIIDYKTNRPPPLDAESVAESYLLQLAAYRLAIAQLYPDKAITCALLWTDGPRIMEIPDQFIDRATEKLWSLGQTKRQHLDA